MMEVVSGDNWSYNTCKAPVELSPPTNTQLCFIDIKGNRRVHLLGIHRQFYARIQNSCPTSSTVAKYKTT